MNENFLIPNQSSLFNIKAIYNTFIDKLGESGFENIIINPEVDELTQDEFSVIKQAGWDFHGVNYQPISDKFHLATGDFIRQDVCTKLRSGEVYTLVLDIEISNKVNMTFQGENVGTNLYSPSIVDINYTEPIDYIQGLTRTLEPVLDEFDSPKRFQVSYNIQINDVPSDLDYHTGFITFTKDATATQDPSIIFHNVSLVKGVLGVNITKRQGFFTDYVRYNTTGGHFEVSMDDGYSYNRILTTSQADVDDFVDILVNNDIIYTKSQCDLQFLRRDIPNAAQRLITFLDGIRTEGGDVNLAEADKLILDGGSIVVNNIQQTGTPAKFFSLMVKRGDERDVGIRYNESIDMWQFTHDGIDWKIFGTGSGGGGTGTGSSELEYYAEILNRTPYAFGYYDLFDEIDQDDSVITDRLNYDGDNSLYKVDDYPTGPWYMTSKNIWNPDHAGNTYDFFIHPLTNKTDNEGIIISYSFVGAGAGDPLLPTDPAWIPVTANEIISSGSNIDELYLKFEFVDETVEFHSYGVFYGTWSYSYSTYTRLREYFTATSTSQTIIVPNGASYTVGSKALELYVNRVRQILGVDYTEVDKHTVQMLVPVNSGDLIEFYEKFGFVDFSEDNSITIDAHIANTSIHCDCPNLTSRISTVETWQTNFSELDATALAALSSHITDTVDAHDASAISVISTNINNSSADNTQTILEDFDSLITSNELGLGKNQTWQDMTSTRLINTVYHNTLNAPIDIKIAADITEVDTLVLQISDDNVTYINMPAFDSIIPSNHYYKLLDTSSTTPALINIWVELK